MDVEGRQAICDNEKGFVAEKVAALLSTDGMPGDSLVTGLLQIVPAESFDVGTLKRII